MRAGEVLDGRYRLDRTLGRGGFGVVWAAHDNNIGRSVAVKVLSEEKASDEEAVARFVREAKTAGSLSNPHIVTLHDYGRVQQGAWSTHYLVMELVRGRPLSAVLKEGTPDPALALKWARQVCKALDAAHRSGVVHRDIKPENIMIAESGEAKVLDFGIARLLTQSGTGLTSTGVVIGTPPYLAPECWAGGAIDGRADLYALGVVLFQLCTGQRPFNAGSPVTMMYQHLNDPPPPVRTPYPALAALIRRLLAKDPADRPADAAEVRRLLREIPVGQSTPVGRSTPAPPPEPPEALRQRADRAWEYGVEGRPEEAVRMLTELIPRFARSFGPADLRTLRTCHDLALWLARAGSPGAAAALLRELAPALSGEPRAHADVLRDLDRWERERDEAGPGPARAQPLDQLLGGPAQSG
ncbi:serine/threonine protein kinase [Kitasatospora sp. NBC_01246]|uniref:serine/threonine-protein kinase n=1 Tax=Kitasatospora sp. NBC_01246 TaxID=2903570 RepID=UPI002E35D2F9|nr:serine/threonine-protein kinase [Kitasatospora sp. NBC_01246]